MLYQLSYLAAGLNHTVQRECERLKPRVEVLKWNDDIPVKLGRHGLSTDDAEDVLDLRPALEWQRPLEEVREDGRLRMRPRRIVMTGPDYSGRFLTFILEMPDENRAAFIVTGWPAKPREIAVYRRVQKQQRRRR